MPVCSAGHEVLRTNGYCKECAICSVCMKSLTVAEYEWCLRINSRAEPGDEPRFEHPGCLRQIEKEALASSTVTIPRHIYDKLNAYRLLLEPNMSWGIETNQYDAQCSTTRFNHMLSIEELVVVLARAESMCAALNLATRKDRKPIEISIKKRQANDFAAAQAARQAPVAPKTTAKVERTTERVKLSKEDKLVAVYMNLGYTEAEAREEVTARSRKTQQSQEKVS